MYGSIPGFATNVRSVFGVCRGFLGRASFYRRLFQIVVVEKQYPLLYQSFVEVCSHGIHMRAWPWNFVESWFCCERLLQRMTAFNKAM